MEKLPFLLHGPCGESRLLVCRPRLIYFVVMKNRCMGRFPPSLFEFIEFKKADVQYQVDMNLILLMFLQVALW